MKINLIAIDMVPAPLLGRGVGGEVKLSLERVPVF
jgi:hypothetical protein